MYPAKYHDGLVEEYAGGSGSSSAMRTTPTGLVIVELQLNAGLFATMSRRSSPARLPARAARAHGRQTVVRRPGVRDCTVLVDGLPVSSCCTLLADVDGHDVLTIEGFASCRSSSGSSAPSSTTPRCSAASARAGCC